MSHGADSVKSIIFALCANLVIAVSKLIAAAVTGSGSMMAESIHSRINDHRFVESLFFFDCPFISLSIN